MRTCNPLAASARGAIHPARSTLRDPDHPGDVRPCTGPRVGWRAKRARRMRSGRPACKGPASQRFRTDPFDGLTHQDADVRRARVLRVQGIECICGGPTAGRQAVTRAGGCAPPAPWHSDCGEGDFGAAAGAQRRADDGEADQHHRPAGGFGHRRGGFGDARRRGRDNYALCTAVEREYRIGDTVRSVIVEGACCFC